jgi:hypothetical protein
MVMAGSGKLGGHLIRAWSNPLDVRRTHAPDAPLGVCLTFEAYLSHFCADILPELHRSNIGVL